MLQTNFVLKHNVLFPGPAGRGINIHC